MDPTFSDMEIPIRSKKESNFEHEITLANGIVCVLRLQKTLTVDGKGRDFEKIVTTKTMGDKKLELTSLKADNKLLEIRSNLEREEEKAFNDEWRKLWKPKAKLQKQK